MWLIGYGASTAAGPTSQDLWSHLRAGLTTPTPLHSTSLLRHRTHEIPNYGVHLAPSAKATHRERLSQLLDESWNEMQTTLPADIFKDRVGFLLASTKGFSEDVVWEDSHLDVDTLTPLLNDFLERQALVAADRSVISSACASAAVALTVAEQWLHLDRVDHVVVLACDSVGEFVIRGFHSLQALTPQTSARPFSEDRTGLQLGEAGAALCVSKKKRSGPRLKSAINCEGVAATRPDDKGRSLFLALESALEKNNKPTLVIAHGTGTVLNDATEDIVLSALYGKNLPLVTATKWCIGHTLGVSCAIDVIVAAKCLEDQTAFAMASTSAVPKDFRARYITDNATWNGTSVLVSSLGFGGVHAGVLVVGVPT